MIRIENNWELVEFHDAVVASIHETPATVTLELLSVGVLDGHPTNNKKGSMILPKSYLRFTEPRMVTVRSYQSSVDRWTTEKRPYRCMKEIAEIKADGDKWYITGFDATGTWIEWMVEGSKFVYLEALVSEEDNTL